jgi:nucleoside-diphosphate-sugar epimerase
MTKSMNETVLLTGGTGFLGSHIVHELVHNDYHVVVLKRSTSNTWRIDDVLGKVVCYDVEKTGLEAAFTDQHIDVVVHTACCYGRNNEATSTIVDTNVMFGLKLFELAGKFSSNTFFNTGTLLQKHLNSYSLSKQHLVDWLKQLAGKVQVINMKLEHMYGPKDDVAKFVPWIISQLNQNQERIKLTSGIQERDFVHVWDVVRAYLKALEHRSELKEYDEFEVGTGHSVAVREFVTELARQYRERNPENQTRLDFGVVPYRSGEMMCVRTDIKPLTDLGWKAEFSFQEGIKTVIPALARPNS